MARLPDGARTLLLALLFLPGAVPAAGLEVQVAGPGESLGADSLTVWTSPAGGDTLLAAFRASGVFEGNAHLGEGIAATLLLVVDLWEERGGWWDSLVRSQVLVYRFRVDAWTGAAELLDFRGVEEPLPDRETLRTRIEQVHEVLLGTSRDFREGKRYYLTVKAFVRPMKLEDLEEVDAWLSGRVTGSGGGVLGIPKAVARVLLGASGLGDETAEGRSGIFLPRR